MPSEILENISLYCLISLTYFRLLFKLSLIRSSRTRGSGTSILSRWSLQKLLSPPFCRCCYVHALYSRSRRPHSFWSEPRIATSGRVQFSDHAQSNRFAFSVNHILVPRGRAPFGQHHESRFLVLTKRSAASGDENESMRFVVDLSDFILSMRRVIGRL